MSTRRPFDYVRLLGNRRKIVNIGSDEPVFPANEPPEQPNLFG